MGNEDFEDNEDLGTPYRYGAIKFRMVIFPGSQMIDKDLFVTFDLEVYRSNSIQLFIGAEYEDTVQIHGRSKIGFLFKDIVWLHVYLIGEYVERLWNKNSI